MARKRKLDATIPEEEETVEEAREPRQGMGGMWAGSAMNMLRQRIEDANDSLHRGILNGTVAIELDPDQIEDSVGSDRMTDWREDESFAHLVANIKRRGQTQPIRVRPKSKDWEPDQANPLVSNDKFNIQSGRRRLEACRELGRKVLAIVSTEEGDAIQADLEERFLENTMRKDLNGFEELISIGALAKGMKDLTQMEIADRLGIPQGDVSLGLGCLEFRNEILDQVDIAKAPKRYYRSILPKLKRGKRLKPLLPPALTGDAPQSYDVRGIPMMTKPNEGGFSVNIRKANIARDDLEDMLVDIARVVMKYQMKR
ncbi:ParB/RepB/Spo0J family partition protein [Amaricoccus tamworthensis]|uniref:ParB/RepB/Spo0J family partition protein n=1 Tax=Amaricoccus tamworthensis TaxID=57002 RepID=UPI003C79DB81